MKQNVRYVLFEDEYYTSLNVKSMISRFRPNYRLVGESESVDRAVGIMKCMDIDLVISSMQLADGNCMEILKAIHSKAPVIIMAEKKSVLDMRHFHIVDILLKPVSKALLCGAILKYEGNLNQK